MTGAAAVVLGAYAAVYAALAVRVRRRGRRPSPVRAAAFALGLIAVGVALTQGADGSLAAHAGAHELLLNVAPVLLLCGIDARLAAPLTRTVGRGIARRPRRIGALRAVGSPALALAAYVVAGAVWHLAVLRRAAGGSTVAHGAEHLTLLWAGLLFWFHLLRPLPSVRRLAPAAQIAYLAAGTVAGAVVAAVLVGAPEPLYPGTAGIADQRLAGGLMMAVEMPLALGVATAVLMRAAARTRRPAVPA